MHKRVTGAAALLALALQAAEMTDAMMTEEGWFHGKQSSSRYDDLGQNGFFSGSPAPSATLRMMWIDAHKGEIRKTATAVGGHFGLQTPADYPFALLVGLQTSQKLRGLNPDGDETLHQELYGKNGNAFAYLSEAELRFAQGGFSLRAGRLKVETPFADPDDIRMAYNTFEGAAAGYAPDADVSVELLYLNRWAGFDSGETQSEFVPLADGSQGLYAAGVRYAPAEEQEASLWAYRLAGCYQLLYAEAVGRTHFAPLMHLEWGVQTAMIDALEHSETAGSVVGATGIFHYRDVYGGVAYNRTFVAKGKVVTDGFGGGPYFTSLDEATVGAVSERFPGEDLSVFRVGGGIGFEAASQGEGLHLEALYGLFAPERSAAQLSETDLLVWTDLLPSTRIDAVLSSFDVRCCGSAPECEDFVRLWIRLDHSF